MERAKISSCLSGRLFPGLAAALLLWLLLPSGALAHAQLVRSDPAAGAVLATAPTQVKLWYDEDVDVQSSQVQVLDKNLARVDDNDLTSPGDPRQLVITLQSLSDGTYTVVWKALSADDGHVTRGNFSFSLGRTPDPALTSISRDTSGTSETDPLSVLARGVHLLFVMSLVGAVLFRLVVLERSWQSVPLTEKASRAMGRSWQGVAWASLGLGLLSALAGLFLQASIAGGVPLTAPGASQILWRTLKDTWFGNLLLARLLLLLALAGSLKLKWEHGRWLAALLGLAIVSTLALGAHAVAAQGILSVAVLAEWVHLAGASLWVGGLFCFLAVLLASWRSLEAEGRTRWLGWAVPQFSKLATPTTALITLTGVYLSLLEIPSFKALLQTIYGDTLILKVILFVFMLGFSALNLLWLRPRFRRAPREQQATPRLASRFRLTISAQGMLGAAVILLAGLLTLEPPARSVLGQPTADNAASNPAMSSPGVLLLDEAATDVEVTLTIKPTIANANVFDIYLTNPQFPPSQRTAGPLMTAGTPIANALRVMVQFTLLDQDVGMTNQIAESQGKGHYLVRGDYLTLPGMWNLHVIVRRAGQEDVAVDFPVYKTTATGRAGPSDPQALRLLQDSDKAMNELQSLRARQEMNDGSTGVVITDYEYRAPDAMAFQVRGQLRSIAIGRSQFYLGKQGTWRELARVDAVVFPQFGFSDLAHEVQLGRTEVVNGEDAQIVRYFIPAASGGGGAEIAEWISLRDYRLLQLAMNAPDHYMMQYYLDYDSPQIVITAPANAAR